MDRKAFLKSLRADGEASSSSRIGVADRKSFLKSAGRPHQHEQDRPYAEVDFTLGSLFDFKGMLLEAVPKAKVQVQRKRPNYDGTRRRLLARPLLRKKWLCFEWHQF